MQEKINQIADYLRYSSDELEIIKKSNSYLMNTYARELVITKGKGMYLYDKKGYKYLDLIGGIATCSVGHANKRVIDAIIDQLQEVINPSNLYYSELQAELAEKLCKITSLNRVFISNSGTEAIECAIKLFRRYVHVRNSNKNKLICFKNSFHGRTLGSLSATYEKTYKQIFEPLVKGMVHIEYNSISALENALKKDKKIGGILIEPIQGEAGVIVPSNDYLKQVFELCRERDLILILDEIQTGNGRTGKYFCYQHSKIDPDIVVTAKGLANGIPIGATISRADIDFEKKEHGSTFGGNSVSCAAALATIKQIELLMPEVASIGKKLLKELENNFCLDNDDKKGYLTNIRGMGLMIGATISSGVIQKFANTKTLYLKCLDNKLLVNFCHEKHLRLLPPLIIKSAHVREGIDKLRRTFGDTG
ncbi:MAG: acetylornithine/succinylornithine family transaminase [Candidatus Micrarchaeota archaeon]|nr:acetylornithine/succinylornithine family transaminase [Candidatus Micrarchaeota archaeon]